MVDDFEAALAAAPQTPGPGSGCPLVPRDHGFARRDLETPGERPDRSGWAEEALHLLQR